MKMTDIPNKVNQYHIGIFFTKSIFLYFQEIFQSEKGDVLVSPVSLYSLLAILQHGTYGTTRDNLENVLHASAPETRLAFYNLTTSIEVSASNAGL